MDYKDFMVVNLAPRAVERIAAEAVREASPDLKITGVMPGLGGTSYVEILIRVEGWDQDDCQITVGAFRNSGPAALKKQISDSLQRRLHGPSH